MWKVCVAKTHIYTLIISPGLKFTLDFFFNVELIEHVTEYKYLVVKITNDGDPYKTIKSKINRLKFLDQVVYLWDNKL